MDGEKMLASLSGWHETKQTPGPQLTEVRSELYPSPRYGVDALKKKKQLDLEYYPPWEAERD